MADGDKVYGNWSSSVGVMFLPVKDNSGTRRNCYAVLVKDNSGTKREIKQIQIKDNAGSRRYIYLV